MGLKLWGWNNRGPQVIVDESSRGSGSILAIQASLAQKANEIDTLQSKVTELEKVDNFATLGDLGNKLEALETKLESINTDVDLDDVQDIIEDLSEKMEIFENVKLELRKSIDSRLSEISQAVKMEIDLIRDTFSVPLTEKVQEVEQEITGWATQLEGYSTQIDHLQDGHEGIKKVIDGIKGSSAKFVGMSDKLKEIVSNRDDELKAKIEIESQVSDLAEKVSDLDSLKTKVSKLKGFDPDTMEMAKKVSNMYSDVLDIISKKDKDNEEHQQTKTSINNLREYIETTVKPDIQYMETLKTEVDKLKEESQGFDPEVIENAKAISGMFTDITDLISNRDKELKEKEELTVKVNDLKHFIDQQDYTSLQSRIASVENEFGPQARSAKSKLDTVQSLIEKVKTNLSKRVDAIETQHADDLKHFEETKQDHFLIISLQNDIALNTIARMKNTEETKKLTESFEGYLQETEDCLTLAKGKIDEIDLKYKNMVMPTLVVQLTAILKVESGLPIELSAGGEEYYTITARSSLVGMLINARQGSKVTVNEDSGSFLGVTDPSKPYPQLIDVVAVLEKNSKVSFVCDKDMPKRKFYAELYLQSLN